MKPAQVPAAREIVMRRTDDVQVVIEPRAIGLEVAQRAAALDRARRAGGVVITRIYAHSAAERRHGSPNQAIASLSKGDRVLVKGRLDFRKYQNKDGVEVTTHDIIADEVAPSLKYATAQISRIERESTGSGARRGNGGGRRQQADPVYGDTEPFADLGAHRFGFRNMAGDL